MQRLQCCDIQIIRLFDDIKMVLLIHLFYYKNKDIYFVIIILRMFQEVAPCSKCKKIPQDILMMSCNHDICLDCSADRLSFQLKKKKQANSIVCQICYQRTPLDPSSIAELLKICNNKDKKMAELPKKVEVPMRVEVPKIERAVQKKEEVAESHILGSLPSQLNLSKETLAIFAKERIDSIETLALLTEEDYKELKIPMGERKRLLKAFNK